MTKETLLYKLTDTENPRFVSERENCVVNKCLELINEQENINSENVISINELFSALEQTERYLRLMSQGKSVKCLDECLSHAELTIKKYK